MGGVIFTTTVSLFHFLKNSQHPRKWSASFKNFFTKFECIKSSYLAISSNLLKTSFSKSSLFVLAVKGVVANVSFIFQTKNIIVVIKILEKYMSRTSVLERNFNKLFVSIFIKDFNHKSWNTCFEEQAQVHHNTPRTYFKKKRHVQFSRK